MIFTIFQLLFIITVKLLYTSPHPDSGIDGYLGRGDPSIPIPIPSNRPCLVLKSWFELLSVFSYTVLLIISKCFLSQVKKLNS